MCILTIRHNSDAQANIDNKPHTKTTVHEHAEYEWDAYEQHEDEARTSTNTTAKNHTVDATKTSTIHTNNATTRTMGTFICGGYDEYIC